MKRKLLSSVLALVLVIAMLMTACGSAKDNDGDDKDSTKVTYKNELNVAITANPPSLDPHSVNSNIVAGIGYHIYEPLFALNADYEVVPVLAEDYEVDSTGTVYTITLRKGIKFHNGQEMKANDVVASMTRWLSLSGKANNLIGGSTFEKVDDYTVKMTVNQAASDVMLILAGPIQFAAIYPASVVESATEEGISEYIGTGAYKLKEWKQDQYVQLTRYEDYQATEGEPSGFTGKKSAPTENIYFRVVTDSQTRISGVTTGQYDIAESIPLDQYATLAEDKTLTLPTKTSGTLNLFFNTTEGIMANQDMRQAILAALNMDDIMLGAYGDANLYTLNPGWCNPNDAQWGTDAGKDYYNQNDTDKVKDYLTKAGYNNEEIILVTTPDYTEMYNATLVVHDQLVKAGINAKVESYDFTTFMEKKSLDTCDLFITSNSYNMLPVQLTVLTESWKGLSHQSVTDGISNIRFAASTDEAVTAWQDLQTFLYEYGAASVLGHYSSVIAVKNTVEGYENFHYPVYWNVKVAE